MRITALCFVAISIFSRFASSQVVARCPTRKSTVRDAFAEGTKPFMEKVPALKRCRNGNADIFSFPICRIFSNLIFDAGSHFNKGLGALKNDDLRSESAFEDALNKILDGYCSKVKAEHINDPDDIKVPEIKLGEGSAAGGIIILLFFGVFIFAAVMIFKKNREGATQIEVISTEENNQNPQFHAPQPTQNSFAQAPSPYYVPNAPSPYNPSPYPQQYGTPSPHPQHYGTSSPYPQQYPWSPVPSPQQQHFQP